MGQLKTVIEDLTVMDSKIVQAALNDLENILRLGEQEAKQGEDGCINLYYRLIEDLATMDSKIGTRHD